MNTGIPRLVRPKNAQEWEIEEPPDFTEYPEFIEYKARVIQIDEWPKCAYQALPSEDRDRQFHILRQREYQNSHRLRVAEGVAKKTKRKEYLKQWQEEADRKEYFSKHYQANREKKIEAAKERYRRMKSANTNSAMG